MLPSRIQRKRTKGWRLPENTVCISRPSRFGNPFRVGGQYKRGDGLGHFYEIFPVDKDREVRKGYTEIKTNAEATEWFEWYMGEISGTSSTKKHLKELEGKNLACWCKEGEVCHGDVWLRLANEDNT